MELYINHRIILLVWITLMILMLKTSPRQKMDQNECRVPSELKIDKAKQNTNTGVFGRVDELRAYKKKYGHLNIIRKDDRSLYNFCYNIRQSRRAIISAKGNNTNYALNGQIAALDAIGFSWEVMDLT